jgi:hypothetical protein
MLDAISGLVPRIALSDEAFAARHRIDSASTTASGDIDRAVSGSASAQEVIEQLEQSVANITTVAQLINAVARQAKSLAAQTAAATARIEATVADQVADTANRARRAAG